MQNLYIDLTTQKITVSDVLHDILNHPDDGYVKYRILCTYTTKGHYLGDKHFLEHVSNYPGYSLIYAMSGGEPESQMTTIYQNLVLAPTLFNYENLLTLCDVDLHQTNVSLDWLALCRCQKLLQKVHDVVKNRAALWRWCLEQQYLDFLALYPSEINEALKTPFPAPTRPEYWLNFFETHRKWLNLHSELILHRLIPAFKTSINLSILTEFLVQQSVWIQMYYLGLPILRTQPDETLIQNRLIELSEIGSEAYLEKYRSQIVSTNTTDVYGEDINEYSPIDQFVINGQHPFVFTGPELAEILKTGVNPYNKQKLSLVIMQELSFILNLREMLKLPQSRTMSELHAAPTTPVPTQPTPTTTDGMLNEIAQRLFSGMGVQLQFSPESIQEY